MLARTSSFGLSKVPFRAFGLAEWFCDRSGMCWRKGCRLRMLRKCYRIVRMRGKGGGVIVNAQHSMRFTLLSEMNEVI